MAQQYTNLAITTLGSYYTAGDSTVTLAGGGGNAFPATGNFTIGIYDPPAFFLLCTARSGDVLTVNTTATEGTNAISTPAGVAVAQVMTAGTFDGMRSDMSKIGTFANRPSSGMKSGDYYKCTDSATYDWLYDGSVWQPIARCGLVCTLPPSVGSLTWINQGGATATNPDGSLLMTVPASSSDNLRYLGKTYPATPFTWTIGFTVVCPTMNYFRFGIGVSDGTKLLTFAALSSLNFNGGWGIEYVQWPGLSGSAVNYQAWPVNGYNATYAPVFMTLNDNGSNLTCWVSNDPFDLQRTQVYQVGRTAYLTPSSIGVVAESYNSTWGASMRVFHWTGI